METTVILKIKNFLSFSHRTAMMKIVTFCSIFLILNTLFATTVRAQDNKVLIVNSDNSVYRYQEIASEFKKVLKQNNYAAIEFDLAIHHNEDELKKLLQQEPIELIYCIGTKAYSLLRTIAGDKKLLFSAAINWRRLDISADSYGVANELAPAQEISLLRYFFPSVRKIGLLYNDKFSREYLENIKQETQELGVTIISHPIDSEKDITTALQELLPKVDIFWIISDPIVLSSKESVQTIFQEAKKQKKPVYAYSDVFIEQGAVLTISADVATIGRQSANLVMMINNHTLPVGTVQIPAGSTVTLNKCSVDSLPIRFNQDALDSVNQLVNCSNP